MPRGLPYLTPLLMAVASISCAPLVRHTALTLDPVTVGPEEDPVLSGAPVFVVLLASGFRTYGSTLAEAGREYLCVLVGPPLTPAGGPVTPANWSAVLLPALGLPSEVSASAWVLLKVSDGVAYGTFIQSFDAMKGRGAQRIVVGGGP